LPSGCVGNGDQIGDVCDTGGMYDPTMRVLTVLELLQTHERLSGAALAERLEVNVRTVQRYVARLQDLGVPVESSRGLGGAYRLRPGFRLPPLMFSDDEALAVSLGLRALEHLGLHTLASGAASVAQKLARVLPLRVLEGVRDVEAAVALQPWRWTVATDAGVVRGLAAAIRGQWLVAFGYQNHAGEQSQRSVEPHGLLHDDGRWYLLAYCRLRAGLRTFRLDRVVELQVLAEHFERRAIPAARDHLHATLPFVEDTHQVEVWLDCDLTWAEQHCQPSRVRLEALASGGVRLCCARDRLEPLALMLLRLGCGLRVVAPTELREVFAALAAKALAVAQASE
jgi:predicted DNA-binding transcriptional regulator YafY